MFWFHEAHLLTGLCTFGPAGTRPLGGDLLQPLRPRSSPEAQRIGGHLRRHSQHLLFSRAAGCAVFRGGFVKKLCSQVRDKRGCSTSLSRRWLSSKMLTKSDSHLLLRSQTKKSPTSSQKKMSHGDWLSCCRSPVLEVAFRDKHCCCQSRGSDGFSQIPASTRR